MLIHVPHAMGHTQARPTSGSACIGIYLRWPRPMYFCDSWLSLPKATGWVAGWAHGAFPSRLSSQLFAVCKRYKSRLLSNNTKVNGNDITSRVMCHWKVQFRSAFDFNEEFIDKSKQRSMPDRRLTG